MVVFSYKDITKNKKNSDTVNNVKISKIKRKFQKKKSIFSAAAAAPVEYSSVRKKCTLQALIADEKKKL